MIISLPWPDKRLARPETISRFWEKVDVRRPDDCWIWTGAKNSGGYGSFGVHGCVISAHRMAALVAGIDPAGSCVCHRCDNPACVNPDHLFLGSHDDNMADKVRKGRQAKGPELGAKVKSATPRGDKHPFRLNPKLVARGERSGVAKFKDEEIRRIRSDPRTAREIAADYNVGKSTISAIKSRVSWAHVQ